MHEKESPGTQCAKNYYFYNMSYIYMSVFSNDVTVLRPHGFS